MLWRESCAAALAHQNMQTVLLKDLEVPQVSCWRKANTESLVLVSGRTCQITGLSSEQPDNEGSVMGRTTLGPGVFSHTSCFLFKCYLNSELRWTCHSVSPEIVSFFLTCSPWTSLISLLFITACVYMFVMYGQTYIHPSILLTFFSADSQYWQTACFYFIILSVWLSRFAFLLPLGLLLSGIVPHSWYWRSSLREWRNYCMYRAWVGFCQLWWCSEEQGQASVLKGCMTGREEPSMAYSGSLLSSLGETDQI